MLQLLTTPGDSYREAVHHAIERAQSFTWVVAFASDAGVDEITPSIERQLTNPKATARLIVGVDRQGFNTAKVFRKLLVLQKRFETQLELGVVPEQSGTGFMHAKALLTSGPEGVELIVGSANLTHSAAHANHELALHMRDVPRDIHNAFHAFVRSLHYSPLTWQNADEPLKRLANIADCPSPRAPLPATASVHQFMATLTAADPSKVFNPPDELVRVWIERGHFVGRGSRANDALVLRLPLETLAERRLIEPASRKAIGPAARESRTLGYSIELLPAPRGAEVRKLTRRIAALPLRLGLHLPCFGLWMPDSYWAVFEQARNHLLASAELDEDSLIEQAQAQRRYLVDEDGIEKELAHILERLGERANLSAENEPLVAKELRDFLRVQLPYRTPEVIARSLMFRTARQRWAPSESTDMPYRQLLRDIVQATFASTYRTGRWPRQVRSEATKELLRHASEALRNAGFPIDDAAALNVIRCAERWEDTSFAFDEVVREFCSFIPAEIEFPPPDLDKLIAETAQDEGPDGDEL